MINRLYGATRLQQCEKGHSNTVHTNIIVPQELSDSCAFIVQNIYEKILFFVLRKRCDILTFPYFVLYNNDDIVYPKCALF